MSFSRVSRIFLYRWIGPNWPSITAQVPHRTDAFSGSKNEFEIHFKSSADSLPRHAYGICCIFRDCTSDSFNQNDRARLMKANGPARHALLWHVMCVNGTGRQTYIHGIYCCCIHDMMRRLSHDWIRYFLHTICLGPSEIRHKKNEEN